jgi:hypothetical protein
MPRVPDGALAQLGERYTGSVEVSGSIPLGSTNIPVETDGFASFIRNGRARFPQSFPHQLSAWYRLAADVGGR